MSLIAFTLTMALILVTTTYSGEAGDYSLLGARRFTALKDASYMTFGGAGLRPVAPHEMVRREENCSADKPCTFAVIADLDTLSKVKDSVGVYESKIVLGQVVLEETEDASSGDVMRKVKYRWADAAKTPVSITGLYSERDRGMEQSELVLYFGRMLAFDDRTGIVFEIQVEPPKDSQNLRGVVNNLNSPLTASLTQYMMGHCYKGKELITGCFEGRQVRLIPALVLAEGDGNDSPKGMKIEWSCQKGPDLYIGSFGKEYTTPDGKKTLSQANMWIAVLRGDTGVIERLDWSEQYNALRKATDTLPPGYLIHEAVNWSEQLHKWVFLPRRMSNELYNEELDEMRGAQKVLLASEDFKEIDIVDIKLQGRHPERGFSSFKFLPGTGDRIVIALRTAENATEGKQETFLSIFDIMSGDVLLNETRVSGEYKFEGIELW